MLLELLNSAAESDNRDFTICLGLLIAASALLARVYRKGNESSFNIEVKLSAAYNDLPIVFSKDEIEDSLDRMSQEIESFHEPQEKIKLLCLLNGAKSVTDDLVKRLGSDNVEVIYTKPSSYRGETHSQALKWDDKPTQDQLQGKIVIVDDVLDTGKTMFHVVEYVKEHAEQVHVAVLINKEQERKYVFEQDLIVGATATKELFLVGRGMDYNGQFRKHDDIRSISPCCVVTNQIIAGASACRESIILLWKWLVHAKWESNKLGEASCFGRDGSLVCLS